MKKVNRVFNTISVSILVLVLIGVSGTYLSDYLVDIKWFDDYSEIKRYRDNTQREFFYWGARHYWYNWGIFLLFCTAIVRAVTKVVFIVEED